MMIKKHQTRVTDMLSSNEPNNFNEFIIQIENFKNNLPHNHSAFDHSFSDNNFANLKATCGIIHSAEKDLFYTEDEINKLIAANKKADLKEMKEGVLITLKHQKYRAAMQE